MGIVWVSRWDVTNGHFAVRSGGTRIVLRLALAVDANFAYGAFYLYVHTLLGNTLVGGACISIVAILR